MGVLKDVILNLVCFGFVESFIFLLFIKKIGNINILTIKNVILIGCLFTGSFLFIPPLFRQLFGICILCNLLIMVYKQDIKKSILLILGEYGFILVIETISSMSMEMMNLINIPMESPLECFICMVPMRILEILLILLGGKLWVTSGTVKSKSQK